MFPFFERAENLNVGEMTVFLNIANFSPPECGEEILQKEEDKVFVHFMRALAFEDFDITRLNLMKIGKARAKIVGLLQRQGKQGLEVKFCHLKSAVGETRTLTTLRSLDPESSVSTNSTTTAYIVLGIIIPRRFAIGIIIFIHTFFVEDFVATVGTNAFTAGVFATTGAILLEGIIITHANSHSLLLRGTFV